MLRWVRGLNDAKFAFDFFAARCDVIRVMPFMDGIPVAFTVGFSQTKRLVYVLVKC